MTSHHPIRKVVNPEPPVIPDKLYFRIGDVAKLCDVPAYVLRFWETEFPQLKPNKGGTGQRLYRRRDVETALRIKSLLYDQGYTIPGARQVFSAEAKSTETRAKESKESKDTGETAPRLAAALASTPVPAATHNVGAILREGAQRRHQLIALRDELRSIGDLLSKPVSPGSPISSLPALGPTAVPLPAPELPDDSVKTMGPRLVPEPAPEVKPDARHGAKPSQRHLDQGDLFPTE